MFGQHRDFDALAMVSLAFLQKVLGLWQHTKRRGVYPTVDSELVAMLSLGPRSSHWRPSCPFDYHSLLE